VSVCLFVVAANEGWKPQSAEHLAIVDVLGINSGVVALTKSDLVDDATIEEMSWEVSQRFAGTSLEQATVVPCSATTGFGIDSLLSALDEAVMQAAPPRDRGRPRLWVDRSFTISGAGTVVTGTLTGGALTAGQSVEVQPSAHKARIRSIQNHKREVDAIDPGNRVALNLSGLERREVKRGDAIVLPQQWLPTRRVDALVRALPALPSTPARALTEKGAHLLYVGSAETATRVRLLDADQVEPGNDAFVHLELDAPLPIVFGDRFVLRDAGRMATVGGGRVLDPLARRPRRSDKGRIALLERLAQGEYVADPVEWAALAFLDDEGEIPVGRLLAAVGTTDLPPRTIVVDGVAMSRGHVDALLERLSTLLSTHHHSKPLELGMEKPTVAAALDVPVDRVSALAKRSAEIVDDGRTLRLARHSVRFDPRLAAARDRLLKELDDSAFAPAPIGDLQADARLLKALVESGEIVRVGDFFLTKGRAAEARSQVRRFIDEHGSATVAQIRDLLRTSRKYAVPLCEWLDSTGATMRRGDVRILGPRG
nr:SelB C-terminal domain-containing protein [Actinomycetota bacterium]